MPFQSATRRKFLPLASQAKGATNPLVWQIPKTGLFGGIYLDMRLTAAGIGAGADNALGMASSIRRVRVITNAGIDLIDISGPGYYYLLKNFLEDYRDPTPGNNVLAAPANAAFNFDMYIPMVLNSRDPVGLFMLQNEQTSVQLQVEFEADAVVEATAGFAITGNVNPSVEIFTVPVDPKDWPPLNVVQQILEDSVAIAGAGAYDYYWPRGNTYVQVLHALGIAAPGAADGWSRAQVIVNQGDVIADYTPNSADIEYGKTHGVARGLGTIPVDLIGTSGLGTFGSARDLFYSARVTDLFTRITATGAGTLRTVRRQLVSLK